MKVLPTNFDILDGDFSQLTSLPPEQTANILKNSITSLFKESLHISTKYEDDLIRLSMEYREYQPRSENLLLFILNYLDEKSFVEAVNNVVQLRIPFNSNISKTFEKVYKKYCTISGEPIHEFV